MSLELKLISWLFVVLLGTTSGGVVLGDAVHQMDQDQNKRVDKTADIKLASSSQRTQAELILLTVDKTNLQAYLQTWPEETTASRLLRSFRIAIGKADGDKQVEGDNKTPEGIYFAQSHIDGAVLPPKYGDLAIPIDFPNPIDRIARKTGHGIWLHGVEYHQRIEEAKVTEGCVAFYNPDISRLSYWLREKQGLIVIAKDLTSVNAPEDLEAVKSATTAWMTAWKDRNTDSYGSYYDEDFRFGKHSKASYLRYKENVFASYKKMDITFDNIRVVTHPKYAVSFFNQDFQGDDRYSSIGRKILYWTKSEDGNWKIVREVFENSRFEFVTFSDAELALLAEPNNSALSRPDGKASHPNL